MTWCMLAMCVTENIRELPVVFARPCDNVVCCCKMIQDAHWPSTIGNTNRILLLSMFSEKIVFSETIDTHK